MKKLIFLLLTLLSCTSTPENVLSKKDIALLDLYYVNKNKYIINCQLKDTISFLLTEINIDSTKDGESVNYSFCIPVSNCSKTEQYFNISLINSITYKDKTKSSLISGTLSFTDIDSFFPENYQSYFIDSLTKCNIPISETLSNIVSKFHTNR